MGHGGHLFPGNDDVASAEGQIELTRQATFEDRYGSGPADTERQVIVGVVDAVDLKIEQIQPVHDSSRRQECTTPGRISAESRNRAPCTPGADWIKTKDDQIAHGQCHALHFS